MKKIDDIAKNISGLNGTELELLSEVLLTKHDISATIYRFGVVPMIDYGQKTDGDLFLISAGSSKLGCVKTIKDIFQYGLREAKDIVDNAPILLAECVSSDDFEKIKEAFDEYDCIVELR